MNDINQRISRLSAAKRAVLEQQLNARDSKDNQAIPSLPDDTPTALSFAQQRMWLMEQLEPGSPSCNRPTHFYLTGSLDVDALRQALNEIVHRHQTCALSS